jgi:hypothetical protein
MLQSMLDDYREKHPGDPRSDRQLLDSLMNYFVETGTVRKDAVSGEGPDPKKRRQRVQRRLT